MDCDAASAPRRLASSTADPSMETVDSVMADAACPVAAAAPAPAAVPTPALLRVEDVPVPTVVADGAWPPAASTGGLGGACVVRWLPQFASRYMARKARMAEHTAWNCGDAWTTRS